MPQCICSVTRHTQVHVCVCVCTLHTALSRALLSSYFPRPPRYFGGLHIEQRLLSPCKASLGFLFIGHVPLTRGLRYSPFPLFPLSRSFFTDSFGSRSNAAGTAFFLAPRSRKEANVSERGRFFFPVCAGVRGCSRGVRLAERLLF